MLFQHTCLFPRFQIKSCSGALDSLCDLIREDVFVAHMTLLFAPQESFSVLDSGIYRVISRRGSQSDEDSCSLNSQTLSEDERLKEFSAHQEEEQVELGNGLQ